MKIVDRTRGTIRLARIAWLTFSYLMKTRRFVKRGGTVEEGLEIRRSWSERFAQILNIHIKWEGSYAEDKTVLFIGNHRSSIDPQLVMGRVKGYPVSRADVRNWPFVGEGAANTGILFVDKSSKESRRKIRTMLLEEMQKGNSILIFPEGHTNVKPLTDTFQKGSFDQAAAGGFPVQPYVIEYKDKNDYWDHTDSFAVHFIKRFGKKRTDVTIRFGPLIESDNSWTLLRTAQAWIDENIIDIRKGWGDMIEKPDS